MRSRAVSRSYSKRMLRSWSGPAGQAAHCAHSAKRCVFSPTQVRLMYPASGTLLAVDVHEKGMKPLDDAVLDLAALEKAQA